MEPLAIEVRDKLLKRLNLSHVDASTITLQTPLFGDGAGLELDSLDALEISILVEQQYGIAISVAERTSEVFGTFGNLVAFIEKNRNRDKKS
jgi:acyl carrier protein